MTKQLDTLIERGASCVGGDIIFRGKSMGTLKNEVFAISSEGEAELAIDEAPIKSETPKPRATKAKPAKAEPAKAEPVPEVDMGDLADLADLAGLDQE